MRAANLIRFFGTSSANEIIQMMQWTTSTAGTKSPHGSPTKEPSEPSEVMLAVMAEKKRKLEDREKARPSVDQPLADDPEDYHEDSTPNHEDSGPKKPKRKGDKKKQSSSVHTHVVSAGT